MHYITKIKNRAIKFKDYILRQARKNTTIVCMLEKRKLNRGYKIYKSVSIDNIEHTYIFPYNSLGDIYIISLFFWAHNRKFINPFQLVVTGGGCLRVAKMMGIEKCVSINARDMRHLSQFAIAFQRELPNLEILHFEYPHTSLSSGLSNLYRLNFVDCYEEFIFSQKISKMNLRFNLSSTLNEDEINELGIIKGMSIIISPYAKSIQQLPEYFWIELSNRLTKLGFNVYTNCNGNYELPIRGTKRISFTLEKAVSILDYAGLFIGLRSGFCDIISSSKCEKVVIYSRTQHQYISNLEHYSLKKVPGARNFKEVIFSQSPDFISYVLSLLKVDNMHLED